MVLRKKEIYTVITPIPGFIPRQLAIDILHSHGEVITLNPLVLSHKPIKAPRNAPSDEYYSTWYEITERVQFVPGIGKLGSGVINFNGCFHDLPWGLQTHIYAPANVDLRNKYRIGGNQPGVEPQEQQEMGLAALGAPKDGLYMREDIEIRCNFAMVSFVKAQLKAASKEMVDRIIKKAELLDAGVLTAMIEDGKIKTQNPNDRSFPGGFTAIGSPPPTPGSPYRQSHMSLPPASPGATPYQIPRPLSYQVPPSMQHHQQFNRPGTSGSQNQQPTNPYLKAHDQPQASELPAPLSNPGSPQPQQPQHIVMELPGDMYHLQPPPQGSPSLYSPGDGSSKSSPGHPGHDWRWSQSQPSPSLQNSRPISGSSEPGGGPGGAPPFASPPLDHKGFASELATHNETREEEDHYGARQQPPQKGFAPYNPADYARLSR